jgi:hypothetical protein
MISGIPMTEQAIVSVLALPDFDRFVYVLSILERFPDQDCAVLLNTSPRVVPDTWVRVQQHIANSIEVVQIGKGIPNRSAAGTLDMV